VKKNDRSKTSHSLTDAFYWQVPGDVPGWRSEADPFQSKRPERNHHHQLIPKLESTKPQQHTPERQLKNASAVSRPLENNDPVEKTATRWNWSALPSLALLSLGLLIFLFVNPQKSLNELMSDNNIVPEQIVLAQLIPEQIYPEQINSEKITPEKVVTEPKVVEAAKTNTKQNVFEITLGEKTKTPQSKLQVITHVVVKGDTLWDISETYVKDPFRYPELAKLSSIINPDLIYPNDLVRIHIYN